MTTALGLTLAGSPTAPALWVEMTAPEPLQNALRTQYGAFCLPPAFAAPPQATLTITPPKRANPAARAHLVFAAPQFAPGRAELAAPGVMGALRLPGGQGMLAFDNAPLAVQVAEVDYFLRFITALLAFELGGLLFHGAGVLQADAVYIFFGPSGSGKTTATRLSAPRPVLNDDLLVLLPTEKNRWLACATPFTNPTQAPPTPLAGPLAGLYRLVQDVRVYREPLRPSLALAELLPSLPIITADPARAATALPRLERLLAAVPACALHFRKDPAFWEVIDSPSG